MEQTNHTAEEGIWNAFLDEIEKDGIKTALVRVAQFYHTQRLKDRIEEMKRLRSKFIEKRDKHSYHSPNWWKKHERVYAMDEAITLLQNHIDDE